MKNIKSLFYRFLPVITLIAVVLVVLFSAEESFARLGGGGGSSSSSGGGDGLGGLIIYLILAIPFPYNIIVVAIVVAIAIYLRKKQKQKTILNQMPTGETPKQARGYDNFLLHNPDFKEEEFKNNVKESFIALQYAWQEKDMSKVRHYISDGMYQRLNTQFKMMDILGQKNTIDKLNVKNVYIDKIESDGLFDTIHVAVYASIVDRFISDKYSKLNSGGSEEFVEYLSYTKKRGKETKDLFHSTTCPNCGGELPKKASDACKCEFCGTVMNSPEYGWILAEITQADDYITANPMVAKTGNLQEKIVELVEDHDDFSVQLLEDMASNGYLQIETARVMNDPKLMRRFVTDSAFEKLSNSFKTNGGFVYNRLFLNDVTLIGIGQKDNKNVLLIAVKSSYQRVVPKDSKVDILDPVVTAKTEVVIMERDVNATKSKGSVYTHQCPSCAGSVEDTLDTKCPYCGSEINATSNDWIISDVLSLQEYYAFYAANSGIFFTPVKPEKIDALYKVRDYAFNNVLIMVAADGAFDSEELAFTEKLAKKWGYNVDKIKGMFQMAQSGKLVLRMPEDQKQREKIYKLMEKAANADGNTCEAEQAILDNVKATYHIQA